MADSPQKVVRTLYQKQPALAWTEEVLNLKTKIEEVLGSRCSFDYVLINLYRDGKDSIGFHSDEEASGENPLCGPKNIIASISLGEARTFILMHKHSKGKVEYRLASGSMIVMDGETQEHYKHGIPKEEGITKPRINLTFRVS